STMPLMSARAVCCYARGLSDLRGLKVRHRCPLVLHSRTIADIARSHKRRKVEGLLHSVSRSGDSESATKRVRIGLRLHGDGRAIDMSDRRLDPRLHSNHRARRRLGEFAVIFFIAALATSISLSSSAVADDFAACFKEEDNADAVISAC